MLKTLFDQLGSGGFWACLVMVSFFCIFLAICVRTAMLSNGEMDHASRLPLD